MARSVRLNIIANYVGSGWSALMGFVFVPVYISYLGIEAYGLIGLFATLQAWLSLLDLGLAPTLSREMARLRGGVHTGGSIRDLLRSIETIYVSIAVLIATAIVLSGGWLAAHWLRADALPVAEVGRALSITGLVIAFRWIGGLYRSALLGLQEQVALNLSAVVFATLRGAGAVAVLAFVSRTIEAFFVFQGCVAALETATMAVLAYRALPSSDASVRFSLHALLNVSKFAGGVAGITLATLMLTQIDKVILPGLLPLSQFGHYALAGAAAGALYVFIGPVTAAIGPRLAELVAQGSATELVQAYHRYAQVMTVSVVPPAIVVCLFSDRLLLLWTRNPDISHATAPIVSVLIIGTMINGFLNIPYLLQLASGWTRFSLLTNLAAVAVFVPALWIFVPEYGPWGAAVIWLVLNLGQFLVAIPLMHRWLLPGEQAGWYGRDIAFPLAAVTGVAGLTKVATGGIGTGDWVSSALVVVFAAVLTPIAAVLATPLRREPLMMVQRLLRQRNIGPVDDERRAK